MGIKRKANRTDVIHYINQCDAAQRLNARALLRSLGVVPSWPREIVIIKANDKFQWQNFWNIIWHRYRFRFGCQVLSHFFLFFSSSPKNKRRENFCFYFTTSLFFFLYYLWSCRPVERSVVAFLETARPPSAMALAITVCRNHNNQAREKTPLL